MSTYNNRHITYYIIPFGRDYKYNNIIIVVIHPLNIICTYNIMVGTYLYTATHPSSLYYYYYDYIILL